MKILNYFSSCLKKKQCKSDDKDKALYNCVGFLVTHFAVSRDSAFFKDEEYTTKQLESKFSVAEQQMLPYSALGKRIFFSW